MRFLSSSALAKAAKFRLATSCSAAETIEALLFLGEDVQAAPSRQGSLGTVLLGRFRLLGFCLGGGLLRLFTLGLCALATCGLGQGGALCRPLLGLHLIRGGPFAPGDGFQRHRAAFGFDRLDRALRGAGHLEGKLRGDLAVAEEPHAVLGAPDQASFLQGFDRDWFLAVETAGIDRGLNAPEIELVIVLGEDIVEAALRQTPGERHLSALEAFDGNARARLLTLDAAAGGLAEAGADTAAEPLARLGRAWEIAQLIQSHHVSSLGLLLGGRFVFHDAHEMADFGHHPAHLRAVDKRPPLVHLVEAKPDQGRALNMGTPDRTPNLLDDNRLLLAGVGHLVTTLLFVAF